MQRIKIPLIAAALLLLPLACSKIAAGGDDEAGGEPPTDQDNYDFPGWIPAAERLQYAPYNQPLPGFENLPADRRSRVSRQRRRVRGLQWRLARG